MIWPQIFTAMITPFDQYGDLDLATAGRLAAWLVDHGTEGLMIAGTTGESPTLNESERHDLYVAVRSAIPNTVPLWVGTGANDTRHAIALTRAAQEWGADGVLVVTPYYNKPPQYALVEHFSQVCQATDLPVMLYNVPGRTGTNVEPATVAQILDRAPNLLAIKEASGNINQIAHLLSIAEGRAKVYSGDDALFYPSLALGAYGVVSVASHVIGDHLMALMEAWNHKDIARAQQLHRYLLPIFEELFRITNPIPVKWALAQMNWPVAHVRMPLAFPEDRHVFDRLESLLHQALSLDLRTCQVG